MQQKEDHKAFLKMAVNEAFQGMRSGKGGPFGAIIIRDGKIIGRGHNTVLGSRDPTAHAEINAIRAACLREKSPHLHGAVIYSNFEPCPMCLAAIYWAGIRSIFYCNDRTDAEKLGFMDRHLYEELSLEPEQREIRMARLSLPEMEPLMAEWMDLGGKNLY